MPGEDIYSWLTVAANNGDADTLINWVEGQTRASVNNSSRSEMAAHAKNRNLLTGAIVTTGSANAQQFLSGNSYTVIPLNMLVRLKVGAGLTNGGPTTLSMDGLPPTLVVDPQGRNLSGGEFTGGDYTELLWNGTNWLFLYSRGWIDATSGGIVLSQQVFSTAGAFTYTPSVGMECCIIECIGGGGGGGGASGWPGRTHQGGGGGSGGYSRKLATAADIGASQAVTVGSGGGGGAGVGNGGNGTATGLGTLCTTNGGGGGLSSWESGAPAGGSGGTVGAGDCVIPGTPGGSGFWGYISDSQWALPGDGGAGPLGGGAATTIGQAGHAGAGYGAGGAGGSAHSAAAASAGGNGASGAVIIIEFAGRGNPGADGLAGPAGPMGPPGPAGAGTGDVLVNGTPSAGQLAQWVDTSHIKGVAAAYISNIVVQTFIANGTYTPTTGMKFCMIECIGAGGGGGGASGVAGESYLGGGGGAGGYSRKRATAADIGTSKAVTIGGFGTGGNGTSNGTAGTATSVGALCIANGGSGGVASYQAQGPAAGGGAAAGTGDIALAGTPGNGGMYNSANATVWVMAGNAGPGPLGGGAASFISVGGQAGNAPGAGGAGASAHNNPAGFVGGNGAAGMVIITEYI